LFNAASKKADVHITQAIDHASRLALLAALATFAPAARAQNSPADQKAEAAQAGSVDAHLGRGYAALKDDRYDEAAREFRAALALDPKLTLRARFPLAVTLFESQKTEEARKELEAVRSEVGDRPDVMYYLGRLELTDGNFDKAIQDLTEAAQKPPFPDTAYYLGSAYLKKGALDPAAQWLEAAARLNPRDPHVLERLGALYRQQGRKAEAEKAFADATELRQQDATVSRQRIDCAQKLESSSLDDARQVCEQLFDPNDADKLTMLGTLYGQHGDYAEALKPLRRAAELSPDSPQTEYNLALDCFELQHYAEARQALEKVMKLWPDLSPLNTLYGAVLYKLGDESSAYQALSRAHELNPQDARTAMMLYESGVSLAMKSLASKEYQASMRYLREAAQLAPRQPEPHRLLAQVYRAAGRDSEAAEEQRQFEILSAEVSRKSN
jgi:tetratricopeptide (TPR) repeat protein